MSVVPLLVGSILLQVGAATFALRLMPLTGRRSPWLLLATAMVLMAVRRAVTLWYVVVQGATWDFDSEVVAAGISLLLLAGMALIGPVFRRATRALQLVAEAEQRATALLASVVDIVARLDRHGVIEYASPAVHRVLGLQARDIVGRPIFELLHEQDAERVARFFAEHVGTPGPVPALTAHVRHADGSWRLLEVSANNQLDDPAVRAIILVARDETEREATRAALDESRERFRLVVSQASDGIFVMDPDGRCVDVNPAACELLDYARAALIGKRMAELAAPEDEAPSPMQREELWGTRTTLARRVLLRRDGSRVRVEASIKALPDGHVIAIARDLGERDRTTAALEERERRFRRLVEHGWDVILLIDRDGIARYITPSVERVLGFTVEESLDRPVMDFIHPDDRAVAGARLADILRSGDRGAPVEIRARHKDGSWRWVEATGVNLLDEPSIGAVVGTYRDVTERKEADEELRVRARQQAAVAELGQLALETPDFQRLAQRAVEQLAETLQVEFATVLAYEPGSETLRLMAGVGWRPGLVGTATIPAGQDSQAGYTLRAHAPVIVADFFLEPRFSPPPLLVEHDIRSGVSVPIGQPERAQGVLGVYTRTVRAFTPDDVSFVQTVASVLAAARDRLLMEDRLRASEANYRALVDRATYGLYRSTPSGRLLMANPALAEMLGYDSVDDLLRSGLAQVYAVPGQREELIRRYADADRIDRVEVEWVRKDGRAIRVQLSGQQVRNAAGEIEAFEMIVEDVTQRWVLERQLRQSQKMEAVGQLTGGIAHDFNNILTTVLANADIVAASLPSHLRELRRDVEDVKAAASRGAELIRKLMAFSRREPLTLEDLDLAAVASEAGAILRRLLPEDIELQVSAEPTVDRARADRGAILQILLNLATNARDAMPEGGSLHIATLPVVIDEAQCARWGFGMPGRYLCLEVRDSGVGMDEQTRARIFEPFFTTKPIGKGTGLGLAMVYGLVKQHNGYVIAESELGHGSRFRVYLPVVAADRGAGGEAASAARNGVRGGTETLLLVEDEPGIRRSAKRVLEQFGYRVLTAADGLEALEMLDLTDERVDLVIADVVMPRLTGRKLYEAVAQMAHRPRFLFTSGYAESEMPWEERIAPGVPFLPKPWLMTDLLARVRETLDAPLPR